MFFDVKRWSLSGGHFFWELTFVNFITDDNQFAL